MSNLDKDVDACLEFLIANQKEWRPEIKTLYGHQTVNLPITLIGRTEAKEPADPGQD